MKTLSDWLAASLSSSSSVSESGDRPAGTLRSSVTRTGDQPPLVLRSSTASAVSKTKSLAPRTEAAQQDTQAAVAKDSIGIGDPEQLPPHTRIEVVMVVDRGTQTVTTVGTQTDDLLQPHGRGNRIRSRACAMYDDARCGECESVTPHCTPMPRRGTLAGSYAPHRCSDQADTAKALYEQLQLIESYIDSLITRYNLPPLPML